ncbi:MAG: helix-turn-helix domain-containing protein [Pseudomonadota bacterium]
MERRYLTIAQLSRKLGGRSRSSIYRDVDAGRLPPPLRFGGRVYFAEDDIEAAMVTAADTDGAIEEAAIRRSVAEARLDR